jgi:hypothetical protein
MSEQISGRQSGAKTRDGDTTGAFAAASRVAGRLAEGATQSAGAATSEMKTMLDRQVGNGAEIIGQLATSTRRAAEDFEESAPLVASMVRTLGGRMDTFADNLRGQTVDQLFRDASDLTRRQPAMVFGLAALTGFLACRLIRNASSDSRSSGYDMEELMPRGVGELHGD